MSCGSGCSCWRCGGPNLCSRGRSQPRRISEKVVGPWSGRVVAGGHAHEAKQRIHEGGHLQNPKGCKGGGYVPEGAQVWTWLLLYKLLFLYSVITVLTS